MPPHKEDRGGVAVMGLMWGLVLAVPLGAATSALITLGHPEHIGNWNLLVVGLWMLVTVPICLSVDW